MSQSRRRLLTCTVAGFAFKRLVSGQIIQTNPFSKVQDTPHLVRAYTEAGIIDLNRSGSAWQGKGIAVNTSPGHEQLSVSLHSPGQAVTRIHLRWLLQPPPDLLYLGDHWERTYGDLAWRSMEPERILPWYFLATNGSVTHACGVDTRPAAFAFWQVDPAGTSLWLDVRNGGRGTNLGGRELSMAVVRVRSYQDRTPFVAAQEFCRALCREPLLTTAPVYGGNNWYYAYGHSSAADIRGDAERMSSLSPSSNNRPFMVIDDGWEPNSLAGPWSHGNKQFPDMPQLAADIQKIGAQPGLWFRPLFTKERVPEEQQLHSPNAAHESSRNGALTLDPTVPEVLESIQRAVERFVQWGYRLIKHDFSTYDLLGRWGFNMGAAITDDNWNFADRTRTNAEIVTALYKTLRTAAGNAILLGCNTVGHLSTGFFELQRSGDDTSGRDWNRTRKMGVNTLAFRGPQHNAFFAIDADCVGLTKQVPWEFNRQWLDLLSRSGTPLFVSAAPDALGPEQKSAIRDAFTLAAIPRRTAEPIDWLHNSEPERWSLDGVVRNYQWFGGYGTFPLVK